MATPFEFEKNGIAVEGLTLLASDFVDGVWSSDAQSVGNVSACQVNVDYDSVSPDRDSLQAGENIGYRIRARLETEFSPGKWHTLVTQLEGIDSTVDIASERVLISDPTALNLNPDSEVFDGVNQSTSTATKHVGSKLRLCMVLEDTGIGGALPFVSAKISADGLLY